MLRRHNVIGRLTLTLIIAGPLALLGAERETQEPKTPIARLEVQPARVDWQPQGSYGSLILTVAGPGNLYIQREFSPGETPFFSSFDADGGNLPDGSYAYELRVLPRPTQPTGDEPLIKSLVQSGNLWIQGGSFVDRLPLPPNPSSGSTHPLSNVTPKIAQGQTCIGNGCAAGDDNVKALKLKDLFDLRLTFENTGCCHPSTRNWALQANDSSTSTGDFLIRDLTAGTIPFRIVPGSPGAPNSAFTIFYNGNIGLGTLTPGAQLHMFESATADVFGSAGPDPASGPAFNFGYGGASYGRGAGFLNSRPDASATAPNPSLRFGTANVERMIITNTGDVGIGTSSPSNSLHVKRSDGTAQLLVEETSSTAAQRVMTEWTNNGGVQLYLTDRNAFGGAGVKWAIQNVNALWRITDVGDSTHEMTLDQAGNVTFAGTVTPGSSRTIKEQFSQVDPHDILRRVVDLPITTWSYKATPGVRHLGPMSEDFFTAFSVGTDDKGISVTDSAGVALAAIQGLYLELAARDAQIATLRTRVEELSGRFNGQEVEMALWLAVQELTAQNKQLTTQNRNLAAQNEDFGRHLASLEARLVADPAP